MKPRKESPARRFIPLALYYHFPIGVHELYVSSDKTATGPWTAHCPLPLCIWQIVWVRSDWYSFGPPGAVTIEKVRLGGE